MGQSLDDRLKRTRKSKLLYNFYISFGAYRYLSSEELEASRRLIKRYLKRKAEVEVLVHKFFPRTKKPAEVRMGKGKGKVFTSVSVVRPGQLFFRIKGVPRAQIFEAFRALAKKLPFRILFHDLSRVVNFKQSFRFANLGKN